MKSLGVCLLAGLMTVVLGLPAAALPSYEELGEADPPKPEVLTRGSLNPWVEALQVALNRAGFHAGTADGRFGRQTLAAVYAFQKHFGLERTGEFHLQDWELLEERIEGPGWAPEPDRVEIDLGKQVLYLIQAGDVAGVFPVSSANGERFRNYSGRLVTATTPEGRFRFQRRREGWWESYLGFLYRPFYFRGGYAVHGSSSVPPYPASHGCVRVEVADMDYLVQQFRLGMTVYVYGHSQPREAVVPAPPTVGETPEPPSQVA